MTTIAFTSAPAIDFEEPVVHFTPAAQDAERKVSDASSFIDGLFAQRDQALLDGDVQTYLRAKRSIRSYMRFHAMRSRDASPFPLSHDDHLASIAHQHRYHAQGDVMRMTVGLTEASEWRPPLLRQMDASRGVEKVAYEVPGVGITHDYLSLAQRDHIHPDRDRDELVSDYVKSSIALAEHLGVHLDDLDRPWSLDNGMSARKTNTYPGCD